MNAEAIQRLFDETFATPTRGALAPMVALGAGVLALLLAEIVPGLRRARPFAIVGSIVVAFAFEVSIWREPAGAILGGTLVADRDTALWGVLFLAATLIAWIFSVPYHRRGDRPFRVDHDTLLLCTPIGMMLMVGARDLLVFFVGLELLSIPLYALCAFQRDRDASVESGLKYFLLGSFASGFFLYGAALVYASTGTVSLLELAERPDALAEPVALAGVALLAASVFFKVSVFPFHLWVPDVYQGSPTPVTSLMATGTKAAAFGFLLNAGFLLPERAAMAVAAIAVVTMALGNLGALVQTDLKRLLAYSGIAHAGTLLLVVAGTLASGGEARAAVHAAIFYMGAYVFTASGAFGLVARLERGTGRPVTLDSLRGLWHRRPAASAAMALFLLSLGGIPATGGFLGKWFVFAVLVRAGMIGTAVVGVLLSVVGLAYYLRVIVAMFMQPRSEDAPEPTLAPSLAAGVATAACCAVVLAMGLLPGWFLDRLG